MMLLLQLIHKTLFSLYFLLSAEIPLLVVFFAMVFLSSLTAYVHLYVREVYTFSIFVTVDFIQVRGASRMHKHQQCHSIH